MKHKQITVFVLIISTLLFCCKKWNSTSDDLSGNNYIIGKIYFSDSLSNGSTNYPIGGMSIKIAYDTTSLNFNPDITNYLYSVNADSNGNFLFQNLKNTSYVVYATDSTGSIYYLADTIVKVSSPGDTIAIYLRPSVYNQNGIVCTILDSSGAPISGCQMCVFSSPFIAACDTTDSTECINSTYSVMSNNYGKAYIMNIPAMTYTLHFHMPTGPVQLDTSATITVSQFGFATQTIQLKK